jgi:glycosyltransferase involved in cell wall biosynthesis
MLRVAYVFERFPSFDQAFCYREVAELLRQGVEVSVFSIRQPGTEVAEQWDAAVLQRVTYLPGEAELVPAVDRAVRAGELSETAVRLLREWGRQSDFLRLYQAAWIGLRLAAPRPTRVHAHFAGMAARTAYWIRQFFGFDYSFTAHANDIFAPKEFVVSLPKLVEAAAAVVTVSDFSADDLRRRFPAAAAKIHRVYNGVNVEGFRAAALANAVPLVLSVGRLVEKKGFADLIRACALLRDRRVAFRCEVIGEGPLHDSLAAQIDGARLSGQVQLCGAKPQRDIVERLAAADVFVLPCTTELGGGMDNLPTVIMEAMAAGLPVVATPVAGVPEMVQPGVTGELVPDSNPAALADAIATLLADPTRARAMGARGLVLAQERFAIAANVRALVGVLQG